uniref:Branched chain amino acid transaminase 1 n=1 Tax=Oncorhynchus tshawytscha TaxID=74940 RepID=A0A8C8F856_ONCTS
MTSLFLALLSWLLIELDQGAAADLVIELSQTHKAKPDLTNLVFGTVFSDHMLTIEWTNAGGWHKPHIKSLHLACSAMHYAVQLFEGMKAYRGADDKVCLFRPMLNMNRMAKSAERASLLVRTHTGCGTEQTSLLFKGAEYFRKALYIRAWRGGTGDCTMGGNYGASIYAQHEAVDYGCQQVLWLYGDDHQITEVGTMNMITFSVMANEIRDNTFEALATPPLDGIILPGMMRQSILELTRKWGEFKVCERYLTMADLCCALKEGRVKEKFGSGTACVVSPVGCILYQGENLHIPCQEDFPQLASRLMKELTDVQVRWSQTSMQRLFHVGSTSFHSTRVCPVRHV